jgi:cholesterol transport system auxiliary component
MKRQHILILALTISLVATACVKLGGKPLDKRYFQIRPIRSDEPVVASSDLVLKIRRLSVSDLYNTREIVYRETGGRIDSDFYNMFFVTPGNMLTTELRKWLGASGLFSHIIEPGSMVVPNLTLEGVVNSLYGDYSTDTPVAVVEMQFFVVNEMTTNNEIVFSQTYLQRIPMIKADPQQLIQAMTKGVQTIFTDLEKDLAAAPLKR